MDELINRFNAMYAVYQNTNLTLKECLEVLNTVPSESKITIPCYCKDCRLSKYYNDIGGGYANNLHRICLYWNEWTDEDGFCYRGVEKTQKEKN